MKAPLDPVYLESIQQLSTRIVEAQKSIRILDSIKWDTQTKDEFFKHKAKKLPAVNQDYYLSRPLPFHPDEKKQQFRSIINDAEKYLGKEEAVTTLIKRQCHEYIQAVQLLEARGTPAFCEHSKQLYGCPAESIYEAGPRLVDVSSQLLAALTTLDLHSHTTADVKIYSPEQAKDLLAHRLHQFFAHHIGHIHITVNDDMIADASAGADTIKLSQKVTFSERELKYLEVHEGWVHIGTTLNGLLQPYCFFLGKGSPSTSLIQEGLAVLTEVVAFSSYPGRMKKITSRVVAMNKILEGANFLEIYEFFLDCGLTEIDSYHHSVRLFRGSTPEGGPFTKDLAYTKGFILLYNFLCIAISEQRPDLIHLLFTGKLTLDDIPLLLELKQAGLLTSPTYLPPPFQDLAALSVWLSFSLLFHQFDMLSVQAQFKQFL